MSGAVDGLVVDPGTGGKAPGGLRQLFAADQPVATLPFAEVDKTGFRTSLTKVKFFSSRFAFHLPLKCTQIQ